MIDEQGVSVDEQRIKKMKMLGNDERRAIHIALLAKSVNEKLKRGTITNISKMFSVSKRIVARIWKQSKNTVNGVVDVGHRKIKITDVKELKSIANTL